jgi:hypothetical protein
MALRRHPVPFTMLAPPYFGGHAIALVGTGSRRGSPAPAAYPERQPGSGIR